MVPSGRHMVAEQITAVVVPAQHMYKIKPIKIPAHIGNGLLRFCPLCSSYWWVIILRERSYCLLGLRLLVGCPYLCGMVNTSWVLRVNNNDNKKKQNRKSGERKTGCTASEGSCWWMVEEYLDNALNILYTQRKISKNKQKLFKNNDSKIKV